MKEELIPIKIGELPAAYQVNDADKFVLEQDGVAKQLSGAQLREQCKGDPGPAGADGKPGEQGAPGKDATINGQNAAIIEAGNSISIDQQGSALKISANVINKNLLINSYFPNPVNRNGKMEYGSGYTIDGWKNWGSASKIELTENGLHITATNPAGLVLDQVLENIDNFIGKTMTLSFLIGEIDGRVAIQGLDRSVATESAGLLTVTGIMIPQEGEWAINGVRIFNQTDTLDATIIAAKLELGDTQTLAHQENGQWVLNEIPDYAEQYVICSQYSPITGEFVGSQHSNPNLLDNWYFVGGGSQQGSGQFPINQRGEITYTSGYGIDRWKNISSGTITLTENGLHVTTDVEFGFIFNQHIEYKKELVGKTMTLSVLIKDLKAGGVRSMLGDLVGQIYSDGLVTVTGQIMDDKELWNVSLSNIGSQFDAIIVAAKLELGPVQTLAHKEGDQWVLNDPPPNYQQELAKCQRYLIVMESPQFISGGFYTNTDGVFLIPASKMRATPAIKSLSCGGYFDLDGWMKASAGEPINWTWEVEIVDGPGIKLVVHNVSDNARIGPAVLRDFVAIFDANL